MTQVASQGVQRQEAGGVGPLEVVQAQQQGLLQRGYLHQVDERVDHLKPKARIAADRDRPRAAGSCRQQARDRPAARVASAARAAQRVDKYTERAGPLQLQRAGRAHLHAPPPPSLQCLGQQSGLSDTWLSLDDEKAEASRGRAVEPPDEVGDVKFATAQRESLTPNGHLRKLAARVGMRRRPGHWPVLVSQAVPLARQR